MDFILNGVGHGKVAEKLLACNFDINCLRPWIGKDGRSYLTIMERGKPRSVPIGNTEATLRKDDWKYLDEAIVKAAKPRLRAVADLRGRGLQFVIPGGMGKTVLETERMGDINDASISMDALRENENDRPHFDLTNLPLPVIHKDFQYSARQIQASRQGGSPLDTETAAAASRKVAEMAEKLLLGRVATYTYGGGTIYGYTNFPQRILMTLTAPTAAGWVGATILNELLAMRQLSQDAFHYGPWMLYNSPAWDRYLDDDFKALGDITTRERIKKVAGFEDLKTLDYLTNYDLMMVQMTGDVIREVVGLDFTTVQWETSGGLQLNFKVMAILVPQLRADINGNTGVVHGSVAA